MPPCAEDRSGNRAPPYFKIGRELYPRRHLGIFYDLPKSSIWRAGQRVIRTLRLALLVAVRFADGSLALSGQKGKHRNRSALARGGFSVENDLPKSSIWKRGGARGPFVSPALSASVLSSLKYGFSKLELFLRAFLEASSLKSEKRTLRLKYYDFKRVFCFGIA